MAINLFVKKKKYKGMLLLPMEKQKRLFKIASEKSTERQLETLRKYDKVFGERITNKQ